MATSPSREGRNPGVPSDRQALTQIEGIGKAKQQWLESIGIATLQDLAQATVEAVESQLMAMGHPTNPGEIGKWIAQAQELVADLTPQEEAADVEVSSEFSSTAADETAETAHDVASVSGPIAAERLPEVGSQPVAGWEPLASFSIEYQYRQIDDTLHCQTWVRHLETGQEQTWSEIEEEALQAWLRSHITPSLESLIPETATTDNSPYLTPVIEDLRIFQPPSAQMAMEICKPSLLFPSPVKSHLPFTLELQIALQDPERQARDEQTVAYQVECYARSLKGGGIFSIGDIPLTPLPPQPSSFLAPLLAIALPPGLYRLQVLLTLKGIKAFPAFIEIPVLQVA